MHQRHATLTLPDADKVLYKLCKHYALKVPVEFNHERAHVPFPAGTCDIQRQGDTLHLQCAAPSDEALARVLHIMDEHLALMARNPELQIPWQAPAGESVS